MQPLEIKDEIKNCYKFGKDFAAILKGAK